MIYIVIIIAVLIIAIPIWFLYTSLEHIFDAVSDIRHHLSDIKIDLEKSLKR